MLLANFRLQMFRSRAGREGELTQRDWNQPGDKAAIPGSGAYDGIDTYSKMALSGIMSDFSQALLSASWVSASSQSGVVYQKHRRTYGVQSHDTPEHSLWANYQPLSYHTISVSSLIPQVHVSSTNMYAY